MNKYACFYGTKAIEVLASTSYEAQVKAANLLKAKKDYQVTVILVEKDGAAVTYTPTS